jgi:hypothetical protein
LSIYNIAAGKATDRIFYTTYTISGTGIYTFPVNLDLQPGVYAYATNQEIIQGYRAIQKPDNIFGVAPALGSDPYIIGKYFSVLGLPDPYPAGQIDLFEGIVPAVPLVIFETEIL